jgi:hypothetical protein
MKFEKVTIWTCTTTTTPDLDSSVVASALDYIIPALEAASVMYDVKILDYTTEDYTLSLSKEVSN